MQFGQRTLLMYISFNLCNFSIFQNITRIVTIVIELDDTKFRTDTPRIINMAYTILFGNNHLRPHTHTHSHKHTRSIAASCSHIHFRMCTGVWACMCTYTQPVPIVDYTINEINCTSCLVSHELSPLVFFARPAVASSSNLRLQPIRPST